MADGQRHRRGRMAACTTCLGDAGATEMTDTSDATPRPDDMPEMVPSAKKRLKAAFASDIKNFGWDYPIDECVENAIKVVEDARREGFTAGVLAERSNTPEPSASALERARALRVVKPIAGTRATGLMQFAEDEVKVIAAAITSAETAARASVDPAAIRRAALDEAVAIIDEVLSGVTGDDGNAAAMRGVLLGAIAFIRARATRHPSVQPEGWRSNMEATPENCPHCGYTEQDALVHGDHYLCKGRYDAPWNKRTPLPAPPAEDKT